MADEPDISAELVLADCWLHAALHNRAMALKAKDPAVRQAYLAYAAECATWASMVIRESGNRFDEESPGHVDGHGSRMLRVPRPLPANSRGPSRGPRTTRP